MSAESEDAKGEILVGTIQLFREHDNYDSGPVAIHGTEPEIAAAILSAFDETSDFDSVVIAVTRGSADLEAPADPYDPRSES